MERENRRGGRLPRRLRRLVIALLLAPPVAWGAARGVEWALHRPAAQQYERGNALYRAGEFEAAMEAWQAAIRADPRWAEPYVKQAEAFRAAGRSDLAIGKLLEAAQASPRAPHLPCRISEEYLNAEDSLEAGLWATRAVEAEPTCPRAHLVYARTHRNSVEEAQKHLETAVQFAPDQPEPLLELAKLHAEAGNLPKAEEVLQRLFQLRAPDAQAHYLMGMVQARRATDAAQRTEAERHLRESIRLAPNSYDPHAELGLLLERQRRWKDAAAAFEHARELNPYSPAILFHLATVYQRSGDPRAAQVRQEHRRLQEDTRRWTELRRQLQGRPDDLNLTLDTAEAALRLGARVIALNLVRSVLERDPSHARARQLQQRLEAPAGQSATQEEPGKP